MQQPKRDGTAGNSTDDGRAESAGTRRENQERENPSGHGMQVTPRQQQQIAEQSAPVSSAGQATEYSDDELDELKGEEQS